MTFALKEKLLDMLFPRVCATCGADRLRQDATPLVCKSCLGALLPMPALHCPVCRREIPLSTLYAAKSLRCHPTASHLVFSAISYENPVAQTLIKNLKFKRQTDAAGLLASLVAHALIGSGVVTQGAVFVPIPLSQLRYRQRGFNQAALIASQLSRHFHLPLLPLLVRSRHTPAQSDLKNFDERRVNIAGAFLLSPDAQIPSGRVILVDDVWTSGATMSEAVSTLRAAGVKEIIALTVARAGTR